MNLNKLAKELSDEGKIMFGDQSDIDPLSMHMLMVSEIAEATEESRKNNPKIYYVDGKPEGETVELADCLMRILHYCGMHNLDIGRAVAEKRQYNKDRNWKSEGKRI